MTRVVNTYNYRSSYELKYRSYNLIVDSAKDEVRSSSGTWLCVYLGYLIMCIPWILCVSLRYEYWPLYTYPFHMIIVYCTPDLLFEGCNITPYCTLSDTYLMNQANVVFVWWMYKHHVIDLLSYDSSCNIFNDFNYCTRTSRSCNQNLEVMCPMLHSESCDNNYLFNWYICSTTTKN